MTKNFIFFTPPHELLVTCGVSTTPNIMPLSFLSSKKTSYMTIKNKKLLVWNSLIYFGAQKKKITDFVCVQ